MHKNSFVILDREDAFTHWRRKNWRLLARFRCEPVIGTEQTHIFQPSHVPCAYFVSHSTVSSTRVWHKESLVLNQCLARYLKTSKPSMSENKTRGGEGIDINWQPTDQEGRHATAPEPEPRVPNGRGSCPKNGLKTLWDVKVTLQALNYYGTINRN